MLCRDVERSLTFYTEVLGLEPVRVEGWRAGEVLFPSVRIDATTILDLFPSAPEGRNIEHFCLVIEPTDLDALAASGSVEVASGPSDGLFGARGYARSLYIRDPDGHVIELRSY